MLLLLLKLPSSTDLLEATLVVTKQAGCLGIGAGLALAANVHMLTNLLLLPISVGGILS